MIVRTGPTGNMGKRKGAQVNKAKEIKFHRFILAAVSPYFYTLLTTKLNENKLSEAHLDDF